MNPIFDMRHAADDPLTVLLVEDDEGFGRLMREAIKKMSQLPVTWCQSLEAARACMAQTNFDIVLTDLSLPDGEGTSLIARPVDGVQPWTTIVMTGFGNVAKAVAAIKAGAFDFIEKPFSPEKLWSVMQRATEHHGLQLAVTELRQQLSRERNIAGTIVGKSAAIVMLRERLLQIGAVPADVLLIGETGTGKELLANSLHQLGNTGGNFVAVNCAAIPDGLFENELFGHEAGAFTGALKAAPGKIEQAQNGTLFLDEIESMPIGQQIKLLRVLQERSIERLGSAKSVKVKFRLVAASKVDLAQLSKEGKFREDLWHRLNVIRLKIPTLRERREDIVPLFRHFLVRACARYQRSPYALALVDNASLISYEWPGNVRELQHAAERYALGQPMFDTPTEGASPSGLSLEVLMGRYEKEVIRSSLAFREGDAHATSKDLGVSLKTLSRRVAQYGLQAHVRHRFGASD